MEYRSFYKEFSSKVYNIKNVVTEIMSFINSNFPKITENDFYDLKLVFSELLINAVIHGNNSDDSKIVSLKIDILETDVISATIIDEGLGFDYMKLSQHINQDNFNMEEGGRGICLVQSLADQVSFSKKGNEIKFKKKVASVG